MDKMMAWYIYKRQDSSPIQLLTFYTNSKGAVTLKILQDLKAIINRYLIQCELWQYGLWSFQTRGTKLERFLPKNQHTQRKLLNFENWISGGLRSFQKSEF